MAVDLRAQTPPVLHDQVTTLMRALQVQSQILQASAEFLQEILGLLDLGLKLTE